MSVSQGWVKCYCGVNMSHQTWPWGKPMCQYCFTWIAPYARQYHVYTCIDRYCIMKSWMSTIYMICKTCYEKEQSMQLSQEYPREDQAIFPVKFICNKMSDHIDAISYVSLLWFNHDIAIIV